MARGGQHMERAAPGLLSGAGIGGGRFQRQAVTRLGLGLGCGHEHEAAGQIRSPGDDFHDDPPVILVTVRERRFACGDVNGFGQATVLIPACRARAYAGSVTQRRGDSLQRAFPEGRPPGGRRSSLGCLISSARGVHRGRVVVLGLDQVRSTLLIVPPRYLETAA
jgi:hypothetical protein